MQIEESFQPPKLFFEDETEESSYLKYDDKRECRICQDQEPDDDLIDPCKCSGSIKFIHKKCLEEWVTYRTKIGDKSERLRCSVCGEYFLVKWLRPTIFDYISYKSQQYTLDYAITQIRTFIDHLIFHTCSHFLICWVIKVLSLYLGLLLLLFIGRLELWLVSSETTWEEFSTSLEGTMDNLLLTLLALGVHGCLFFVFALSARIFFRRRSARAHTLNSYWADLRGVVAISIFGLGAICLPGYKARLILYLLFNVPFNRFEVNFGTGRNFSAHFISGLLVILVEAVAISTFGHFFKDYTTFREKNARRVLGY